MNFHIPTHIIFESGALSQIQRIVETCNASRPFLVTDQGVRKAGIADTVLSHFPDLRVCDTIEQNPKSTTINAAAESARALNPDLIIGLGGGSAIDAAKSIALLATNPGTIEEYEGKHKYTSPPLPVLAIPTTCGTGSEVTWVAVITHVERKFKMSIKGPHLFPEVALIDPDTLKTLPHHLIASTGMDALTHALEAYTAKPRTPITDLFALKALQLIFESLEPAYNDISNKRARESMMLASTLAGIAFGNSDVGAVHCVAETLGGLYDIPHGVANSVVLPFVMEFNLPVVEDRYAAIARTIGIEEKDDTTAAHSLIKRVKLLSRSVNIPTFQKFNINKGDIPEIAEKSFHNNSNPSNPREARVEDYVDILTRMWA